MTSERWARVKVLFHEALEVAPHERAAFLAERCAGDAAPDELRAELERLLAAHARAGGFIERPPHSDPSGSLPPHAPRAPLTGRVVGRYEVGRLIGEGGMGQVYAATDRELGRTVALKVAFGRDEESQSRLRREAQHASRLNHPHICTIHEVGSVDGQAFIVMELVEGRRLADLIPPGGLPIAEVLRYGRQIADALAHAHGNGVTHRDLKTANVIVTPDGRAKVLDFGLARRLSEQDVRDLSQSQTPSASEPQTAGTLACMAPELLRAEPANERSDVWALGVLLYEMAAGTRPFRGATGFELSGAILHEAPSPLPGPAPASLEAVIRRCLAKSPADRFKDAGDVLTALDAVKPSDRGWRIGHSAPATRARRILRDWRGRAALVSVALAVGFATYRGLAPADTPLSPGPSGRPAIAVLPFASSGDIAQAWLSQGVPSMLITGLAQARELEVIGTQRLQDVLRQDGRQDLSSLDASQLSDIARRAGAAAIVAGNIYHAGTDTRIDVRIEDLATGRVLAAERVQGGDVFALVDQLTSRIRNSLGPQGASPVRAVADVSTPSLEAFRLYSEGLAARSNFRFEDAEKLLLRAVAVDPGFGQAYLELAFAANTAGARARGREYLDKAAANASRLSDRGRLLLKVELARADRNFVEAAQALEELIATYPDVESAYSIGAELYGPVGPLVNLEKMLNLTKSGVTALPLSPMTRNTYAVALIVAGRYVEALREFEAYARLAPNEAEPYTGMATTYLLMGLPERSVEAADRALKIDPALASAREGRAWSLATMGRFDEALATTSPSGISRLIFLATAGRYREADRLTAERVASAEAAQDHAAVVGLYAVACRSAMDRGDYPAALRYARAAARSAERLPAEPRRFNLVMIDTLSGVARARTGEVDRAASHLDAVKQAHRSTVPIEHWFYKALEGEIALARGDLQAAARTFADGEPPVRAFGFGPGISNNPPFTDGLARVARARGDLPGAIRAYRRLLTQGPEHKWLALLQPRYVLEVARLLERTGDLQAARQEYERFLDIWKRADADLPELTEARAAVARLR
jgi:tetratricopeptide (TPR) repeat protein